MVDEKRKQLLVQILQQQTPVALAPMSLTQSEIASFIRKIEDHLIEQGSAPTAIAYWSSNDSHTIQPQKSKLLALQMVTLNTSAFSEHREEKLEELCFYVQSKTVSLFLYAYSNDEPGDEGSYQCLSSIDLSTVKRASQAISPYWEFIDATAADSLDGALKQIFPKVNATIVPDPDTSNKPFADFFMKHWATPKSGSSHGAEPIQQVPEVEVPETDRIVQQFWERMGRDYPYPIAFPYRTIESLTNASEKYKEQLRLVENMLALVAGISLALCVREEPRMIYDLKDCVISGVSVGHWRELIRKCTVAWKNSSTKDIPLARAISDLRIEQVGKGFGKAIEQLIRMRNDFAHHRAPTAESQIAKESAKVGELLMESMSCVGFLCDFPIRVVRNIDVLPTGVIRMTCLKAIGDHPALRQEELSLNRGFPKGHLIVNAGDANWLSLYPFLTQEICSLCGSMEIYLLDKWKFDKNSIQLRSFERGHIEQSTAVSNGLKSLMPGSLAKRETGP